MEELMTFTVKSNENSERHRKSGNKHFDRGEFYEALLSYNSSICHAELDSRTLALAYGNRSAVYFKAFMYDKCLENIELAKASGFPRDKMSKLRKREQDCNDMIVDHGSGFCFDPWSFFKLSYPTHKKIPFIVNHLELKENEKYGRHIITSYDLSAGDIIAIEEPLFKSLNHDARQSHCYYCLKSNKLSLIPCPSCSSVMHCSIECQDKDTLHQNDCGMESDKDLTEVRMTMDSFRIAGSEEQLIELLKDVEPKTVFDFDLSDPRDPLYEKNLLVSVNSLATNALTESETDFIDQATQEEFKGMRTDEEKVFLRRFITSQYSLEQRNGHLMRKYARVFENPETIRDFFDKPFGRGVGPFTSLFNHSCDPNVTAVTVDNKFVIVVNRPVKAGEQLFMSYGYNFWSNAKDHRDELFVHYKFICDCAACVNDYPELKSLPKKDPNFEEPGLYMSTHKALIAQFKKNCVYIEANIDKQPCYEVTTLIDQNNALLHGIAATSYDVLT